MLQPDDICRAAKTVGAFLDLHGQDADMMPLFKPLGIDEEALHHFIEHAFELGMPMLEPGSFFCGLLLMATAAMEPEGEVFTDADAKALLGMKPGGLGAA